MKRRQAVKCVRRHYRIPMTWYCRPTWRAVQCTLRRHKLAYWERLEMGEDGLWHYTQGIAGRHRHDRTWAITERGLVLARALHVES